MLALLFVAPQARVSAQDHAPNAAPPQHAAGPEHGTTTETHSAEAEHSEAGAHGNPLAGLLWPVANFAVLVAVLRHYLRKPAADYFASRKEQVRKDLVDAAALKAAATEQLAEIDARLKALPTELEALRTRGRQEIDAEQQRIAKSADVERTRLLEQTRRDIELQVRNARRELTAHAARLAVTLAETRITAEITADDHERLARRYIEQVGRQ